jgi:hypothetical protein
MSEIYLPFNYTFNKSLSLLCQKAHFDSHELLVLPHALLYKKKFEGRIFLQLMEKPMFLNSVDILNLFFFGRETMVRGG